MPLKKVVIVGAGFGGLWVARTLARQPVEVTLIDRNNYHSFFPLLYQVSAAEIEPEEISIPIRSILRKKPNIDFDLAQVGRIDLENRRVICEDHELVYDYLVLAAGSNTNYFNIPGAQDFCYSLKNMDQAIILRNHILACFEHARHEPDVEKRRKRLTFLVIGGGATGIEFAGALSELIHGPLQKDFAGLDFSQVKLIMIEGQEALLPMLPPVMQLYTRKKLDKMGVEVRLNARVKQVSADGIVLADGFTIPSETVVWTAGVCGGLTPGMIDLPSTRDARLEVTPTLQVPGHPEIYVVGDLAAFKHQDRFLPMVAPVAVSQGICAGKNILRDIRQLPLQAFRHKDKGSMVVIGRNSGTACIGGFHFTGFIAWALWVFIHLMKLVGFRNRLLVLINWAWDYLFFERSVRLIQPTRVCGLDECDRLPRAF